jgi:hypothetical protein
MLKKKLVKNSFNNLWKRRDVLLLVLLEMPRNQIRSHMKRMTSLPELTMAIVKDYKTLDIRTNKITTQNFLNF